MTDTATKSEVARPLRVLVPLIKKDLEAAKDASQRAGLPYYRAAGEKMLEAKPQMAHGEFGPWVRRNFAIKASQAGIYMQLAGSQIVGAPTFSSLSDFVRKTSNPNYNKPHTVRPQAWHEPVKEVMGKVDVNTLNQRKDALARVDEREAQRKLALQLIDIGYKALATKLHPDRGGSKEAMARLNQVRDRLRQNA